MRLFSLITFLATAFLVGAGIGVASGQIENRVVVRNTGSDPIENLVITNGMQVYTVEYVGPGWSVEYEPPLRTDGGLHISYSVNGETVEATLSGYLVEVLFWRCRATISGENIVGGCVEF